MSEILLRPHYSPMRTFAPFMEFSHSAPLSDRTKSRQTQHSNSVLPFIYVPTTRFGRSTRRSSSRKHKYLNRIVCYGRGPFHNYPDETHKLAIISDKGIIAKQVYIHI